MKNPFSNETVKSAAIVICSAAAFIAISKGINVIRKKFGDNTKVKAIFGSAENANRGDTGPNDSWNPYNRGHKHECPSEYESECGQSCDCGQSC